MFNPVKMVGAVISGIVGTAKMAGRAKAAYERAIEDTDGDNIPQYQEIRDGLKQFFQRIVHNLFPLVQRQFGELKAEVLALVAIGKEVVALSVALFAHVMEAEALAHAEALETRKQEGA